MNPCTQFSVFIIDGYFRFDTLPWETLTGTLMYNKHPETHGILLHPQEALQMPIKINLMPIGRNWMPIKCTPGMPIRNTMMPIGNTLAHTESPDSLGGGEQLVDPGMQSYNSHTPFYSLEINSQTQMDMNRKDLFQPTSTTRMTY